MSFLGDLLKAGIDATTGQIDVNRYIRSTLNTGTAATSVTAVEYGDGFSHNTVLTVTTADVPDIAGGADLAVGILLYTLPAGKVAIDSAYMSMAIQQVDGNITADTPDVALGTVIGSGAVATLDGTATFENIMTGQTAGDCDGTATVALVQTPLNVLTAGAHTVYLNIADGWAASGDANATASGTVILQWRRLGA
jgi:hypothetical protein